MGLFKTRVPQKILFPTLTCGVFVFSSVSTFLRRLPPPVSHSLTHSLSLTLTLSLTHSPTHSLTHSLSHALTHSLHSLTRSLNVHFAWQAWGNVHCQGVGCTPWRPLGLRLFCVAGVGQCALSRARMYALASLGSPPLLRGRRGTMCTVKGSDVRPGVPWVSASFAWQAWDIAMCTAKGSDVRPGVPWVSASFAWQAWDNVHCQGFGCTPWRPLGLRRCCVAGVGQCALPRGRMYALASLGSPPLLRGRRGTMCTVKGSDVRPGVPWVSASLAWQAWHNVHCQGLGCTPWGPLGLRLFCVAGVAQSALPRARMYALASLGSPPLWRGRRSTMCTAKGSDVCPGVPWVSASFAWQAWDNVHCQGVGCTPWRPLGLRRFCVAGVGQCALSRARMYALASLGSPPLLRGRRGTMCHCQGLGCTSWRPLGLRLFCVAGVGQCALPRARMYALASLGSPPLLRGRRGTTHSLAHSLTHSRTQPLTHSPTHSLTLSLSLTHPLTHSLTHPLTHSLTSLTHPTPLHSTPLHFTSLHSTPLHSTPLHSLTHSLNLNIHTHTHKLTHHHRSITLIRPLPFLLFYAQSKSREVGNMWGYIRSFNFIVEFSCADALFENC